MLSVDVAAPAAASSFATSPAPSTPTSEMERDIQAMERNANTALASFHLHLPPTVNVSPRPASCVRPPCLKSPLAQGTVSQPKDFVSILPSSAASSPRVESPSGSQTYSFSAPRCISFARRQAIKRQVHFDSSPPRSYDTFSADDYDRSQIECTQGGSDLDLRMPSKCKRYNSDGEEEQSDDENDGEALADGGMDDDDASSTASSSGTSSRSPPFMQHGGTGWACLRKGSVIGALHSPRPPACRPGRDSFGVGNVSLPVHGVRSFGGLAHHSISSGTCDMQHVSEHGSDNAKTVNSPLHGQQDDDFDIECDDEAVMEAAAIASLPTRSPNATPKPSPSIVPRWARCTDYFESSPSLDDSIGTSLPPFDTEPSSANMAASLSASSSTSSHASAESLTPSASPAIKARHGPAHEAHPTSPRPPSTEARCNGEQTPRAHHTPIATPDEGDGPFIMDRLPDAAGSPNMRSIQDVSTQEGQARRPMMSRAAPFESMIGSAETEALSPVLLSPSPSSDGSMLLSALSGMRFAHTGVSKSMSNDQIHLVSTPSPLSSRCSSIDPWSGLSSSGDEGTTGTSSPCAQWSSCTSPELTPAMFGLASPDAAASGSKQAPVSHSLTAASHAVCDMDGDVSCAENECLPSPARATATSSPVAGTTTTDVLDGARHFLEAAKCGNRSRPRSRSSMLASEGRSSRTSPPSTDEESPRRRAGSRSSSSSAPSSRRSSSSSSIRSSSLCMSMTKASSAADDGDDEVSPEPPATRRSKSRSSSSGATASSGKVKRMPVFRRDSFEDEGALGGF